MIHLPDRILTTKKGHLLPINEESMERSWFITDWAHPCGLLLIHHEVRGAVEALEVCAGARPRRNRHPHLTKLYTETKPIVVRIHVLGTKFHLSRYTPNYLGDFNCI